MANLNKPELWQMTKVQEVQWPRKSRFSKFQELATAGKLAIEERLVLPVVLPSVAGLGLPYGCFLGKTLPMSVLIVGSSLRFSFRKHLGFLLGVTGLSMAQTATEMKPVAVLDDSAYRVVRVEHGAGDSGWLVGDWSGGVSFVEDGGGRPKKVNAVVGFVRDLELYGDGKAVAVANLGVSDLTLGPLRVANRWSNQTKNFNFNLAVNASGTQMMVNLMGKTLHRYRMSDGLMEKEFIQADEVSDLCYLPSGEVLVCGRQAYRILDPETGATRKEVSFKAARAEAMSLNPDQQRMLVLHSRSINVITLQPELSVESLMDGTVLLADACWTPAGGHIVVADHTGAVKIVDIANRQVTEFLQLSPGQTAALAISSDGRQLALGSGQFLDMSRKPPRQKTEDKALRLFALPSSLHGKSPIQPSVASVTKPSPPSAVTPGGQSPLTRPPSAPALRTLREVYAKQRAALDAPLPGLVVARTHYLNALRTRLDAAADVISLADAVALHLEAQAVENGSPLPSGAAPPSPSLKGMWEAYMKHWTDDQKLKEERLSTLRRQFAGAIAKLAGPSPTNDPGITEQLKILADLNISP